MNTTPDTIIALMLSAHTSHQAKVEANAVTRIVIRNAAPTDRKMAPAKSKASTGEQAAPIHQKPQVFGVAMPQRNTLDAKSFLLACRDAGKRSFEKVNEATGEVYTVVKVDASLVREDTIRAIHAYIGYNSALDFGTQDVCARAQASREMHGVGNGPTRSESRAASRTLVGFVAGMPNYMAAKVAELTTREQVTVEALIDAEKVGDKAESVRLTALLSNVRDELATLR